MRTLVPCLIPALILATLATTARAADPVFPRLKAYRTYLHIEKVDRFAQRFTAWFINQDYNRVEVGVNSVEEVEKLTDEQLQGSWGGFAIPPGQIDPIPDEMKPIADALAARLKLAYPELTELKIGYDGKKRAISVEELTPFTANRDASETFVRRSNVTYFQAVDAQDLEPAGIQMYGGLGILCHESFPQDCDASPSFVDFTMPPALEGTSLLRSRLDESVPAYGPAWKDFCHIAIATADALENGTYQNPIETVLARQGDTVLPPTFAQHLEYTLNGYARAEDFQNQVEDRHTFQIPLQEAVEGTVRRIWTSPETGLEYSLAVSFADRRLTLWVKTPGGQQGRSGASMLDNSTGGFLIRDGERVALDQGYLDLQIDEGQSEFSFEGEGKFTSFDIYPESQVYGSPLSH